MSAPGGPGVAEPSAELRVADTDRDSRRTGRSDIAAPRRAVPPRLAVVRCRLLVLAVAAVFTALKLFMAAVTAGTNDVFSFQAFAKNIGFYGPIDIYAHKVIASPYDHPPLTGWLLDLLNWLSERGLPFHFLIRAPATLADVVTCMLVFELVRTTRPLKEATLAGVIVAASPVLLTVSGFHGNTDPIFVMFAMLSVYLLVRGHSSVLAGVSFAAAISIKLVPVVTLPVLLLLAARSGKRRLLGFLGGGAALMALLWGPVVVRQWTPFRHEVLEYRGYISPGWGLVEFMHAAGLPQSWQDAVHGPGRFVCVLLSALVPLVLAWRRPASTICAFGLSLVMVLLLSTATATQYLAWAAAPAMLVDVWAGLAYNVSGGVLLLTVYSRWADALPWAWDRARAGPFTPLESFIAVFPWLALLATTIVGLASRGAPTPRRAACLAAA